MPAPILEVATAEQLRKIANTALDTLAEHDPFGREHDDGHRSYVRFRVSIEALRFVASAAPALGDVSLLPLLLEVAEEMKNWKETVPDAVSAVCEGISELLTAGAHVTPAIRNLVAHHDMAVRQAVAKGLRAKSPAALELLETLLKDPMYEVHDPARRQLAKVREVAWWEGVWASDPIARLDPDEVKDVAPTVEALSKLVDVNAWELGRRSEGIMGHLEALPDALACEAAERLFFGSPYWAPQETALGTFLLSQSAGIDAFLRAFRHWHRGDLSSLPRSTVSEMIKDLEPERRIEVCHALLQVVMQASPQERQDYHAWRVALSAVLAKAWPAEADHAPMLDALFALLPPPGTKPTSEHDWVLSELRAFFRRTDLDVTSIRERLVEACRTDFPDRWRELRLDTLRYLGGLPRERLRSLVEDILGQTRAAKVGEPHRAASWAVEQLLGAVHDAERDPPMNELIRQLYDDPRFRKVLKSSSELREKICPLVRPELRAGGLGFSEAVSAMFIINVVYGGLAENMAGIKRKAARGEGEEETPEAYHQKLHARLEPYLGPAELRGPITEEEWRIYRAARDGHVFESYDDWLMASMALPPGPWQPEDRLFFDRMVAVWRGGDRRLSPPIGLAMVAHPTVEDLPLFDELLAHEEESWGRDSVQREKREAMVQLGLLPDDEDDDDEDDDDDDDEYEDGEEDEDGGASSNVEWMDEPEDEG